MPMAKKSIAQENYLQLRDSIIEEARRIYRETTEGELRPGLPVRVEQIAKKSFNVKAMTIKENMSYGLTLPVQDGFQIFLPAKEPYYRRRFTCAHELGHILFYRRIDGKIAEKDPNPYWARGIPIPSSRAKEESLCNNFASELLLPRSLFQQAFIDIPNLTFESLENLAKTFGVGLQTVIIRIQELHLLDHSNILLLVFATRFNPKTEVKTKLRVITSAFPTDKVYVPINIGCEQLGLRELFRIYDREPRWTSPLLKEKMELQCIRDVSPKHRKQITEWLVKYKLYRRGKDKIVIGIFHSTLNAWCSNRLHDKIELSLPKNENLSLLSHQT